MIMLPALARLTAIRRHRLAAMLLVSTAFGAGMAAADERDEVARVDPPVGALPHIDDASVPDTSRSPGRAIQDVKVRDLCEGDAVAAIAPSPAMCDDMFAAYRIRPEYRYQYECAFLLPQAIGGAVAPDNLWPQVKSEAPLKHALDAEMHKRVCAGDLSPAEAQREIARNWTAAYRRYLVRGDEMLRPVRRDASEEPGAVPRERPLQGTAFDDQTAQAGGSQMGSQNGLQVEADVSRDRDRSRRRDAADRSGAERRLRPDRLGSAVGVRRAGGAPSHGQAPQGRHR